MKMYKVVTCTAPVNIAVVKYWGKRDEKLILPIHDSVSITLSSKHMHAKTSVCMSADFDRDRLWLNGTEESVESNTRLVNCLAQVSRSAVDLLLLNGKVSSLTSASLLCTG